jgi:hypothetical protein
MAVDLYDGPPPASASLCMQPPSDHKDQPLLLGACIAFALYVWDMSLLQCKASSSISARHHTSKVTQVRTDPFEIPPGKEDHLILLRILYYYYTTIYNTRKEHMNKSTSPKTTKIFFLPSFAALSLYHKRFIFTCSSKAYI